MSNQELTPIETSIVAFAKALNDYFEARISRDGTAVKNALYGFANSFELFATAIKLDMLETMIKSKEAER